MSEHKAIAIIGNSGSGKDTIANYLSSKYGFVNVKFGRMHKEITADIFNVDLDKLEDKEWRVTHKHELFGFTPLEFLAVLFKGYSQVESYVDKLHWYTRSLADDGFPVFTDIRHERELNSIADLNPLVINLYRPNCDAGVNDEHISYLQDYPNNNYESYTVKNVGSLESLYTEIDAIVRIEKLGKQAPTLHLFYQPNPKSSVDAAANSGLRIYEPAENVLVDVANLCEKYKVVGYDLVHLFSYFVALVDDDSVIFPPVNGIMAFGFIPQAHTRFLPKLREVAILRVHFYQGLNVSMFTKEELCY